MSSNIGGLPELNVHGETGFLSDVGNIEEMAQHAIYILEDCDRLEKFKQAAYDHAKNFEINQILPLYEAYYQEAIANAKK